MNEQPNEKGAVIVGETPRSAEVNETEDEFKLTVRKLEMPVRPRGVLAE